MRMASRVLTAAALVVALAVTSGWAQAQNVRVRGTIEKVEGDLLMVKTRDNSDLKLKLTDNATVRGVIKKSLADVKAGVGVGVTSVPQSDGTLKAAEIHIFPAGVNFNSFHGNWDLMPGSFMTNGPVQSSVAAVDGQMLTVQYKSGDKTEEKKILVTPQTVIVGYEPGSKGDLKAGQKIFVAGAPKRPDGTIEVASISYGKEIAPPM